jgi:hypothetical protein
MFDRSMTPEQLLAKHNFAVVRVDKNGEFLWYSNSYPLEGSALSDVEENNQYISNGDSYMVVEIDHTHSCDHCDSDTDAIYDRAFRALMRYVFCGLRQLDEQGDTESCTAYALRDVFTFAEGFLASADIDITSLLDGVTAEHHVRQRF